MPNMNNKMREQAGAEGLRQRIRESNRAGSSLPSRKDGRKQSSKDSAPSPSSHLVTTILLLTAIAVTVMLFEKKLPTPLMTKHIPQNPGRFIAERSYDFLVKLTNLGPRPTGSYENEVLAVKLLSNEIYSVAKDAKPAHKILLDVQKTSGSFPLGFLDGMTSVYKNVQNVVVKLSSHKEESPHSLLINCHFDTVPDSPGGSDDGASCAIMLEILRVITQSDTPVKHNIILLFNGAEENLMQASHGFITQHKWAKEIRAFINLEACGAGGREVLFQAGPNHPWLMQKYADSVPYPFASSLAQEIFQSGVIPGDTDYRIFRDFGNISGLDFAWASNGYVYHTKFDNVDQIPLGTLQRTGSNILALTLAIANGNELSEVAKHAPGNLVFFDVLGSFVVRWSEMLNAAINLVVMALSIYTVHQNMEVGVASGMPRRRYAKELGATCVIALVSGLVAIGTCAGIALALTALGRTMSWFARPAWVIFLYITPALVVPMAIVSFSQWCRRMTVRSPWMLFQMHHDANQLLWTALLAITTIFGIRSGFIPCLWVSFSCAANILRATLLKNWKDWKWMLIHVAVLVLPFTQSFYLATGAVNLILPIMGRVGAGNNGELIVALLISVMFVLLFHNVVPMILMVQTPSRVISFLSGLFFCAVALLILTPLGFPYSGDPASPAPQRFMAAHATRTYHGLDGNVTNMETGYWICDMDHNSPMTVKNMVPEVAAAKVVDNCDQQLFCGLPYLLPVLSLIWKTHWIPGPAPVIAIPTTLVLDRVETRANNTRRLFFTATGPDHLGLMVSPAKGITLKAWSHLAGPPITSDATFVGRPIYFVYYSCAADPTPWTFWMDLEGVVGPNELRVDIAISSHFIHGPHKQSETFKRFLGQFPQWATTSAWEATYESWKY